MIVEQGTLGPEFHPAGSVEEAVRLARAGRGVAWVALRDAADPEVESVLDAVGHARPARLVTARSRGHAGFIGFGDHLLVTLVEVDGADDLAPIALQVLAGPDHLVLVGRTGDERDRDLLRRRTEERLIELAGTRQPTGWVALGALLSVYLDRYDRVLRGIEDRVEALNDRLFPEPDDDLLEDAYRINQRIMRVSRALRPIAHGLAEALTDDGLVSDAVVRRVLLRLRTVADDLVERISWTEQTVSSLVDTMLGLISQRSNDLSTRQNAVAQRISAYALLFAIPNALFALYGTNFEHLPRILTQDYGYPLLLGVTVVIVVLTAWQLRRRGWL
jgi:magnesium transporter